VKRINICGTDYRVPDAVAAYIAEMADEIAELRTEAPKSSIVAFQDANTSRYVAVLQDAQCEHCLGSGIETLGMTAWEHMECNYCHGTGRTMPSE